MGHAFLVHLVGEEIARKITNSTEVIAHKAEDDQFSEIHGLV